MTNIHKIESKISSILANNPNKDITMLLFMLLGGIDEDFRLRVLDKITDEMRSPSGKKDKELMQDIMNSYLNLRLK